uniref:PLOD1-3-like GT domain-containing protein n=1 Tax=viral metagenome TaxID=1070528 RepID=A0A6H1ZT55_9ZZZZ
MSSLEVVSAAFYKKTGRIRPFLASCEKHGIEPRLYGVGQKWENFCRNKVELLVPEIDACRSEYVMYSDSDDVLFQADAAAIMGAYASLVPGMDRVAMSGDVRCWPYRTMKQRLLGMSPAGDPFPFICVGLFMGPKALLLDTVTTLRDAWRKGAPDVPPKLRDDDQCWWMHELMHSHLSFVIDSGAKIVSSLHHVHASDVVRKEDGFHAFGRRPAIVHFNGDTSKHLRRGFGI